MAEGANTASWLKEHKKMLLTLREANDDHAISVKERACLVSPQLKLTVKIFEVDGAIGVQEFNAKIMDGTP